MKVVEAYFLKKCEEPDSPFFGQYSSYLKVTSDGVDYHAQRFYPSEMVERSMIDRTSLYSHSKYELAKIVSNTIMDRIFSEIEKK